jgi:hypothetical protein
MRVHGFDSLLSFDRRLENVFAGKWLRVPSKKSVGRCTHRRRRFFLAFMATRLDLTLSKKPELSQFAESPQNMSSAEMMATAAWIEYSGGCFPEERCEAPRSVDR